MATTKSKPTAATPAAPEPLPPSRVHELLGLPEPYESPKPPPHRPGYLTVWDPGTSILELRKRLWNLFCPTNWFEKMEFAKQTDLPQWRQVRVELIGRGLTYPQQLIRIPNGDEVAAARVLVSLHAVHFAATGKKPQSIWLRCRDALPPGNRVLVGGHAELGLDLGSCPDGYTSPAIGLAAVSPVLWRR